jgi:hypothetical protein
MDGFLNAFQELDPTARKPALGTLIQKITPHEWRYMRALLDARTFQFDIVGRLPLELVLRIFSYLDIAAPVRLQAVSSSSRSILLVLVH